MWCSTVGCIVTLALSLLRTPLATTAQPREKIRRVGVLEPTSQSVPHPVSAFQQGLRDLGYVEGQTIRLDYRYAEGHAERLPALAAELVQLAPDVLWLHSDLAAWAATRATTTIPIVVGVSAGLVEQVWWRVWHGPMATSPGWNSLPSRCRGSVSNC